ncbi:tetratricopeptide repeat protein [Nocardia sp. NPDC088792]|uniref:tetratricopeptide repeat protein n=1 Tax=Nocardia sp. NPDC088792 TaxID=3364332 RepID=UPI0037F72FAD
MAQSAEFEPHDAQTRHELRRILLGIGLRENELLEPMAAELRQRGCRPRRAWRLANELTQEAVAAEYNRLSGKANAPMQASRISEFESWPGPRGRGRNRPRPTVEVLQRLAVIYRTSWDQLVDTADLVAMPRTDVSAYREAVVRRSTARPAGRGMPEETMPFVGRQEQRAELRRRVAEQLAANRPAVHVINGLAGMGKTALARNVVTEHAERYPDGWIWEDLRGHSEGRTPRTTNGVLEQLLLRIGVQPETIEPDQPRRAERWRAEMRDRRMLIVFDNVLESRQVRDLLPHSPGSFVLITSRRNLTGLAGAAPLQLNAMARAEAEELLVKLSHLPPGYDVDAVRRILETAGRLPLALRLIAGQLAHGGPGMLAAADRDFQQLTERLKNAPTTEESPAADILARFSAEGETLRAAFELSYQRLPDPELRRAVRLLGWFPGAEITAETLGAMADLSPEASYALIRRIFEVGLLEPAVGGPTGQRYRIHDVTRLFTRVQASIEDLPGEHATAIARLVRYSLQVAKSLTAPRPFEVAGSFPSPPWPDPSEEAARAREWLTREREMLLGCVRATASGTQTGELARLLAFHLSGLGHWGDARWLFRRALGIARDDGDRIVECDVLFGLGTVHRLAFDYETAMKCFKEAHEIAYAERDDLRRVSARWGYAEVTRLIGDYDSSREAYGEVLAIARDLRNPKFEGDALRGLGHIERMRGDPGQARVLYDEALAIAIRIHNRYSRGWSLWGIGNISRVQGHFDIARAELTEADEIGLEIEDPLLHADAMRGMGHICRDLGDLDRAQGLYSDSLHVARRAGDPHGEADAWRALGGIAATLGKRHRAGEFLRKSLALYRSMGVKLAAAQVTMELENLDRG